MERKESTIIYKEVESFEKAMILEEQAMKEFGSKFITTVFDSAAKTLTVHIEE